MGFELEIIPNMHGGYDKSHIKSRLAPDSPNPFQQLSSLSLINKRHKPITDMQFQKVRRSHGIDRFRAGRGRRIFFLGKIF